MAYRLIDSNLEDPTKVDPLAAQATATGYDAETSEVNKTTDTVAGQLNTLLSSGSPYIDRARYSAAETANSRGLLNSSMAAGAGEAAAIDAALPIAVRTPGSSIPPVPAQKLAFSSVAPGDCCAADGSNC